MRTGHWRLSLLGAAAVLAAAATPALAGGQGDVGVVDDVVVVRAEETIPGERGGSVGDCGYEVVISDDQRLPIYDEFGERLFSDSGRWLRKTCDGALVDVGGFFVFPEVAGYNTPDVLAQAIRALDPIEPLWGSSPDGVAVPMVTQLPTWLWVEPAYWGGTFVARAESPSGRVWAEARAVPVSTSWHPGDGSTVSCAGPGEMIVAAGESDCSHIFEHSTAGTGGLPMTVTVTFDIEATTSQNPTPTPAGQITRTSPPVVITVGEIQAIETGGG